MCPAGPAESLGALVPTTRLPASAAAGRRTAGVARGAWSGRSGAAAKGTGRSGRRQSYPPHEGDYQYVHLPEKQPYVQWLTRLGCYAQLQGKSLDYVWSWARRIASEGSGSLRTFGRNQFQVRNEKRYCRFCIDADASSKYIHVCEHSQWVSAGIRTDGQA